MSANQVNAILEGRPDLRARYRRVREFSRTVRSSEYHVTHACNIRCHGCWFFEYEFDKQGLKDEKDLDSWREFFRAERGRGVTLGLMLGGEPTLFPDRIATAVEELPHVWVSSNGQKKLPVEGFEDVTIMCTVFGGGPLDDELRGIAPSGRRLTGLLDKALANYKDDRRVYYNYAIAPEGIPYLEETVQRMGDNGNQAVFNYYREYSGPWQGKDDVSNPEVRLLEEALRVKQKYSDYVISHPYYIEALISGESHWGQKFGYEVCPSVSSDFEGNRQRLANGNPVLPLFNTYAPDLETLNMCCTSGHCEGCRDSNAVVSWLTVSREHFQDSEEDLETWIELSESFWRQFCFSPYHRSAPEPAESA